MDGTVRLECDVLMVAEWFPTFRKNSTRLSFKRKGQAVKKNNRHS